MAALEQGNSDICIAIRPSVVTSKESSLMFNFLVNQLLSTLTSKYLSTNRKVGIYIEL